MVGAVVFVAGCCCWPNTNDEDEGCCDCNCCGCCPKANDEGGCPNALVVDVEVCPNGALACCPNKLVEVCPNELVEVCPKTFAGGCCCCCCCCCCPNPPNKVGAVVDPNGV